MYTTTPNSSEESLQLKQVYTTIEQMKSLPIRDDSDVKIAEYYMGLEDGINFAVELEQDAYKANIRSAIPSILAIIEFIQARKIIVKKFHIRILNYNNFEFLFEIPKIGIW